MILHPTIGRWQHLGYYYSPTSVLLDLYVKEHKYANWVAFTKQGTVAKKPEKRHTICFDDMSNEQALLTSGVLDWMGCVETPRITHKDFSQPIWNVFCTFEEFANIIETQL